MRRYIILAVVVLIILFMILSGGQNEEKPLKKVFYGQMIREAGTSMCDMFIPLAGLDKGAKGVFAGMMMEQVENLVPIYGYGNLLAMEKEDEYENREYIYEEALEEKYGEEEKVGLNSGTHDTYNNEGNPEGSFGADRLEGMSIEELLAYENEAARIGQEFVPHEALQQIDLSELSDYETLVKSFYTIDSNTMAGSSQLNVEEFQKRDMTIDKSSDGPQILIYHTHSQEGFADSVPGDESTTIMGVGDRLAEILEERYGYNVLHHRGKYDVETRDEAYTNALPDIEQVLADNPTIQVVIDLHRDAIAEETRLVSDVDGRPTARFMFFNGLSYTKKTGNISYLYNENLEDNLAFSFKMQLAAQTYYPGLARKIYLKGYRYNMHLKPRTLLIELGAQNNTLEEAMNACDVLAQLLDLVLSGEV